MSKTCIDCSVLLARHNSNIRCYLHTVRNVDLQTYVQEREKSIVGIERWSAGQTNKRHLRDPYIRKFRADKFIPWSATFEEVAVIDPARFQEVREGLIEMNYLHSFSPNAIQMDDLASTYSKEEAELIDALVPEMDFLTRWFHVSVDGTYQRFVSPFDELRKSEEFHHRLRESYATA